jgi:hypothetical protein
MVGVMEMDLGVGNSGGSELKRSDAIPETGDENWTDSEGSQSETASTTRWNAVPRHPKGLWGS